MASTVQYMAGKCPRRDCGLPPVSSSQRAWGHAEIRGKFTHFPSIHMINITILKNHMGIAMRRF